MDKAQLEDRRSKIEQQFNANQEQINSLQQEQHRLQGEFRLIGDLLAKDSMDKAKALAAEELAGQPEAVEPAEEQ
jgi:hypothetical protein